MAAGNVEPVSLPHGVVTFVFSDIEGSTRLWETDADGMRLSLARHDEIVQREIAAVGGHRFKHTGDGFGAAFESVSAGIAAAAGVARAMDAETWPGPALVSRIGVHAGEAEPSDGDYFGSTVTRTARIMDAGNGGQILVSEVARGLLGGGLPNGMSLVDAGAHRLKDLGEPIRLFRLTGDGAEDTRQLRTLERAPHNLPVQLSRFVGREGQIKEISELVRSDRLVTLTGIGGVGKTRLSLQVAAELLGEFEHGAWLVELAPLSEPGLIPDTACGALEIPQDSEVAADQRLVKFLRDREALLIIDNCEHLIDDVARFVDDLLRACPDVRVLATSREGLAVTGEAQWRVPSLRVDEDAAAVELFAERARLVQPGFTVTDANLAQVADLCIRLDGIPLAIELATARLKMLSVEQIVQHLSDRFRLLTGGGRTSVERQRTLKAMMDWSYDLLSDSEQTLLRRLAVFSDGFTYEAAEEVCSGETLARFEVLDLLGRLVEASMVTFESDLRPRYRLLETVRQYALDELMEAGEADDARLRHAEYFRAASRSVESAASVGDLSMMVATAEELGNYRTAMTWALDAGRGEIALELACNLRPFFWARMMYRESFRWLSSALDMVDDGHPLAGLGTSYALVDAGNMGDGRLTVEMNARAERLLEVTDDLRTQGRLANALAIVQLSRDVARADSLFREAARLLRSAEDPHWSAPVQNRYLTSWLMNAPELRDEVMGLAAEARAEGTSIHEWILEVLFDVLDERYQQVIHSAEEHDPADEWEKAMLLFLLAHAQRASGHPGAALETVAEMLSLPGKVVAGWIGWLTGTSHLELGDIDAAVAGFDAPTAYDEHLPWIGDRLNVAWFCAMVAERRGSFEQAATLLGWADKASEAASVRPVAHDERLIATSRTAAREALGDRQFDEAHSRGRDLEWEDLPLVTERR